MFKIYLKYSIKTLIIRLIYVKFEVKNINFIIFLLLIINLFNK